MSDPLRYWVRVVGKVQGVGFRYFVREQAEQMGLSGWVRNDSDGSVECEIQGETEELDRMFLALEQGPCSSRVDSVEKHQRPASAGAAGFQIRY